MSVPIYLTIASLVALTGPIWIPLTKDPEKTSPYDAGEIFVFSIVIGIGWGMVAVGLAAMCVLYYPYKLGQQLDKKRRDAVKVEEKLVELDQL